METRSIELSWDEALVSYLVKKSFSIKYGARNLQRLIQKELEDVAAQKLIEAYAQNITHMSATAVDEHIEIVLY